MLSLCCIGLWIKVAFIKFLVKFHSLEITFLEKIEIQNAKTNQISGYGDPNILHKSQIGIIGTYLLVSY